MGYFIFQSAPSSNADLAPPAPVDRARLRELLESGAASERRDALQALVAARAETELTQCLASPDPAVNQLAITGLWECWLDEEGADARREMDRGIQAMNDGDLEAAVSVFTRLATEHPHWAEALNKHATVLYLQGRPEESIALCRRAVALKPDHFGAWNGMALCAIQIEDWALAADAVRESLRLQPQSTMNRQLLRFVQSRLPTA